MKWRTAHAASGSFSLAREMPIGARRNFCIVSTASADTCSLQPHHDPCRGFGPESGSWWLSDAPEASKNPAEVTEFDHNRRA